MSSDNFIRELRGRVQTEDDDGIRRFLRQFIQACAYGPPAASTTSPEPRRDSPANPGLSSVNANLRDPTTTMNRPLGATGPGSSMRLGEHSTDSPTPIERGHISRATAAQTGHISQANPSFHMQSPPMLMDTPVRRTADWYLHSPGISVFPRNLTFGAELDDAIITNSSVLDLSTQDSSFEWGSSQQPEMAEGTEFSSWCTQDEGDNMVAPAATTNGDEGSVNYQQPNFPSVPQSTLTPQSAQRRPGYEIQSQNQSSPPPHLPPITPQVHQPTGPNQTWRALQPTPPQRASERQQPHFRNVGGSPGVNALSALYQGAAGQRRLPSRRPNVVSGRGPAQQPDSYPGYF